MSNSTPDSREGASSLGRNSLISNRDDLNIEPEGRPMVDDVGKNSDLSLIMDQPVNLELTGETEIFTTVATSDSALRAEPKVNDPTPPRLVSETNPPHFSGAGGSSSASHSYRSLQPIMVNCDRPWQPTVVVIGPGGMKGLLELGFLARIQRSHVLDTVETYIGVSIGAIISILRIVGYTWKKIAEIGINFDLFRSLGNLNRSFG